MSLFAAATLRRIAALLLITFSSLVLSPLQAAAQPDADPPPLATASVAERYGQTLEALKATAQQARQQTQPSGWLDGLARQWRLKSAAAPAVADLREQRQRLDALDDEADADFAATESFLKEKNLPPEILERHRQAVETFQSKRGELKRLMKAVEDADDRDDLGARQSAVDQAARFLEEQQKGQVHTPFDPHNLPFRSPDSKVRAPKETEQEFHSSLFKPAPIQVAALGNVSLGLPAANPPPTPTPTPTPTPDDLAETEDVQLTPAIRAQAAALHNNPVEIFNWVRNNIEFIPTYGSIQGSDLTLQNRRGNAFDSASLLIALLRASNIPARYVYGTIQIPAEQVMNWVGGVTKPEAAQELLGQGGIPNTGLIAGGRVAAIKLEHVWVEAFVDYIPSRGAVNRQGDTWVPMDASFKQYQYTAGMDLKTAVPFDAQSFLAQAQQGTAVNLTEGWVQNLNQANIQAALTGYQNQVKAYIDGQKPNASVGDVLGTQKIIDQSHPILMGTLPYKTLAVGGKFAALPSSLRWKMAVNLYLSEFDRGQQNPASSFTLSLSSLGTRRLAATYIPATDADKQLLQQYASNGQTRLPAYLIQQKTQLLLDNQVLTEYPAQQMGVPQYWTYTLINPNGQAIEEDFKASSSVGDQIVFSIDGNGVTPKSVATRLNSVNPDSALENLQHLALGYWVRADESDRVLAGVKGAVAYRLPSVGMFAQPLSVSYWFGIPRLGSYKSYSLDIRRLKQAAIQKNGHWPTDFVIQSGMKNSYLEGRIYEEIFDLAANNGMSAVSVIKNAVENGVPIWQVNSNNLRTFLAATIIPATVKDQITQAVNAGLTVISPEEGVDLGFWSGQGYIALDPVTGAGAYILNSSNGGEFAACEEKPEPLTVSISQQILTYSAMAVAAALIATTFIPTGGGSGAAAPAIFTAMSVVGISALTWSSTSYAAGKCKNNEKCHRGRLQAQGSDIAVIVPGKKTHDTKSEPWAQPTPLTLSQGLNYSKALQNQLTPTELAERLTYFNMAETKMKQLSASGGVCAGPSTSWSFPRDAGGYANKNHEKRGIRVDIEVKAGEAFVP